MTCPGSVVALVFLVGGVSMLAILGVIVLLVWLIVRKSGDA